MTFWSAVLAQATQPAPAPVSGWDALFRGPMVPILLMVVVMIWWSSRSQRKERDKYQQMLNSLKRNDRIQTVGGIYGTVVEVKDNEIVLKIDEASNVKMRVNRASVKEIYRDAAPAGTEPSKS